ncbi:MAG TPA: hypothetical protein VKT49_03490 [Bryobacteraceae bacterium]|nr:hypothetical protein [Bryobacteraceae bacterium]
MNAQTADTYSHWHQTGPAPRPRPKCSPLDSAIAFERYRLSVVSRWPESEQKMEKARAIERTLKRLESERVS